MEIAGLKLPSVKLARSFSVFSGCVVMGCDGVVAVLTVVLHPPVSFKSANWLTNFCVLRSGIGDFSMDFVEPVDSRFSSWASSILSTTSSTTFDDSVELELELFSIFFVFKSWNFSFFFSVLWFCFAKWSPSVSASSSISSPCLSSDVIEDEAEVEPDDNGGVMLSEDGGGKSITKSGCSRFRVKIADCGWLTWIKASPSALVVLARFCHFSRFCWKILNGW